MRNLSPELLRRIDALDGCAGRWIVDCRAIEGNYSYVLRDIRDIYYRWNNVREAAQYCANTGWKARLLFTADALNADCSWPGGYSAPSIYRSNNRVFQEMYAKELLNADGDADGLALDIRYVTNDMIETIQALQDYPLINEDDHSELELELQEESWQLWVEREWRDCVINALAELAPDGIADPDEWAEERVNAAPSEALYELFEDCREAANEYWCEESGDQWICLESVAAALTKERLELLTLPATAA